jgi:hypothetical protein
VIQEQAHRGPGNEGRPQRPLGGSDRLMGKIIEVPVRRGRSAERDAPGLRQQPEGSAERCVGARCRRCRIPAITYATNRAADGTAALSRPV